MIIAWALIRKNLLEVRLMLLLIATTLFWFCWLFVFIPHRIETRGRMPISVPTIELEMRFWENNPLILLLIGLWAISRGSTLAGEIEKGTMDLIMSRPVRRSTYAFTHLFIGLLGFVVIGVAMLAGNLASAHYNILKTPPSLTTLLKPTLNLAAFGWAVYGYTFLIAGFDIVRWRPILIGSVATIAGYLAHVISNAPMVSEDYKWIDRLSIFRACRLVEVATTGETFVYNVTVLGLIGAVGVGIGLFNFSNRDLPAGS